MKIGDRVEMKDGSIWFSYREGIITGLVGGEIQVKWKDYPFEISYLKRELKLLKPNHPQTNIFK